MTTTARQKELSYVLYDDAAKSQIDRVYSVLTDHAFVRPLTLAKISELTDIPASSVASRIRDIRALGWAIEKKTLPGFGAKDRAFTYLMIS